MVESHEKREYSNYDFEIFLDAINLLGSLKPEGNGGSWCRWKVSAVPEIFDSSEKFRNVD